MTDTEHKPTGLMVTMVRYFDTEDDAREWEAALPEGERHKWILTDAYFMSPVVSDE